MRKTVFFVISILLLITLVSAGWYISRFKPAKASAPVYTDSSFTKKLNNHSEKILAYASLHKYNTSIAFLVDMSIESGKNRFFVMNLKRDSIIAPGLVTHGRCNQTWLSGRKYGNTVGCGCTSLGKYKIGNAYQGRFGLAYKLHGLDATNSNAYKRFVVLHSHECVPANETHPLPLCQSDGCPTVAPDFLKKLKSILDTAHQPVLLYIYE
ncbi:MAG: murein L,D-transpeptidase catalytic domain family protein [Chitinophagaceae bacterium]|nr:murein L,D-transpeptidase catalytic domain family protein [Chitinophagaceae bacterium]